VDSEIEMGIWRLILPIGIMPNKIISIKIFSISFGNINIVFNFKQNNTSSLE
jgi:hypothetical protein